MTTDAEREFYYRIVKDNAGKGEIVELGAWLGASTASIAKGIRDSGFALKAKVYDKFETRPGHARKVREFYARHGIDKMPAGSSIEQFVENMGELMAYVEPHRGKIEQMVWTGGPIAVLISDAPKRVPQISAVLTTLGPWLQPGAIMAWQDFGHFPSYEIPACLYRLGDHLEFVEAVVPGTTMAFRVKSQWAAEEVSLDALALSRWTPDGIADAWDYWLQFVPAEKAELFKCGAAMFLCDIGHPLKAIETLDRVDHGGAVGKKWQYLRENRPDFVTRYAPLFELVTA
jgi:hypothetical protein